MARTLIERGFDPERIVKIYNGMDFDRPKGEFDRVAYLRDTYGAEIEDGDVLCGIAARLTAVKDIATTIRGFAEALKSAPQLRLFIAGDGEDEDMLKKLCDQLGVRERVTFCGWVSPVMPFFRAMDINLLSSVSETFPYSILEAFVPAVRPSARMSAACPNSSTPVKTAISSRSGTISGWRNIWSVWATMPRCGRNLRMRCTKKPPAISRATRCANARWKLPSPAGTVPSSEKRA